MWIAKLIDANWRGIGRTQESPVEADEPTPSGKLYARRKR